MILSSKPEVKNALSLKNVIREREREKTKRKKQKTKQKQKNHEYATRRKTMEGLFQYEELLS